MLSEIKIVFDCGGKAVKRTSDFCNSNETVKYTGVIFV